jgi:hypothetical protein
MNVYVYNINDEIIDSWSGRAMCLYVRRNIEDLIDDDLSLTMDAMSTMWELGEEEGQEIYGEKFHSSKWFAEAHMFNAAQRDADHIHEGLGFIPQHLKISNFFEDSMQSIEPSVTLPYWDFTSESGVLSESIMFTEDTFGSLNLPASPSSWTYTNDSMLDGAIPNGRWAYLTADKNSNFPDLVNAYGYLRGPWNTNPSPYISRFTIPHTSLPSCSAYYEWLKISDMLDFMNIAPFAPHASTHGGIGGVFGCDIFDPLLEQGLIRSSDTQRTICKKWSIIMKELYRADYISPKSDCTADSYDINGFQCGFECNEDLKSEMVSSLKGLISASNVPESFSDEQWEEWRDFVCVGDAHKGSHIEYYLIINFV